MGVILISTKAEIFWRNEPNERWLTVRSDNAPFRSGRGKESRSSGLVASSTTVTNAFREIEFSVITCASVLTALRLSE